MNIEVFKPVLAQIRSEQIRTFTITCLQEAPDYLGKIPASSTGKYHHKTSLGEGGLSRHVLRACHFANYFLQAYGITPEDIRGDVVFAALLLHDIGKKESYGKNYSEYVNHPLTAVEMITRNQHLLTPKVFDVIKNLVKFHMGIYSGPSFKKPITEFTLLELIVYSSDYLSAKKELEITMEN